MHFPFDLPSFGNVSSFVYSEMTSPNSRKNVFEKHKMNLKEPLACD